MNGKKNTRLVAIISLVVIYAFFSKFAPNFFSYTTFVSILDSSYYIGFLAIGATFVIMTGGIDLSCGTVMVCSALFSGVMIKAGVNVYVSLSCCLLFGLMFGVLNGAMVAIMKLPPFIATLGTMMITRGLGAIVSKTVSITFPQRGEIGGGFRDLFKMMNGNDPSTAKPTGFLLLIVFSILMSFLLRRTRPGRYITSLGSNKEATQLSGVDTVKWEMLSYMISGLFAGMAAISYGAIYSTFTPASGNGYELDAIAACVIGGTSLSGGVGTILGSIIGVFIMSVLKVGLPLIKIQPQYQLLFTGIILVLAVFLDVLRSNKNA